MTERISAPLTPQHEGDQPYPWQPVIPFICEMIMAVYDGQYDDYVEADDFDQLVCKVDAISNVVSILIDVLGEVNEEDIAEYAYSLTEHMKQFLPVDEDKF